jgi:hypothetical protein
VSPTFLEDRQRSRGDASDVDGKAREGMRCGSSAYQPVGSHPRFSSVCFSGSRTFHQGPTGVIENIIDGAIMVAVYFATNRNLLAPIIAHGIQDTVDVLLIYFGVYPGLESRIALF